MLQRDHSGYKVTNELKQGLKSSEAGGEAFGKFRLDRQEHSPGGCQEGGGEALGSGGTQETASLGLSDTLDMSCERGRSRLFHQGLWVRRHCRP